MGGLGVGLWVGDERRGVVVEFVSKENDERVGVAIMVSEEENDNKDDGGDDAVMLEGTSMKT